MKGGVTDKYSTGYIPNYHIIKSELVKNKLHKSNSKKSELNKSNSKLSLSKQKNKLFYYKDN